MTDISKAIEALKEQGIEGFERSGILVIPVTSAEEIFDIVTKAKRVFKEIDYQKSWQVDAYYYERRQSLTGQMYD